MISNYFKIEAFIKKAEDPNQEGLPPQNEVPPAANQQPVQPNVEPAANNPIAPQQNPPQGQNVEQNQKRFVSILNPYFPWGTTGRVSALIRLDDLTTVEFNKLQSFCKKYVLSLKRGDGTYPSWLMSKPKFPGQKGFKPEATPYFIFSKAQMDGPYFHVIISDNAAFNAISKQIEEIGFDITPLKNLDANQQQGQPGENPQQPQQNVLDPKAVETKSPSWDSISIRFNYNENVVSHIRQERINGQEIQVKPITSYIFSRERNIVPSQLEGIAHVLKKNGYNTQDFLAAIEEYDKQLSERNLNRIDPNKTVVVSDASLRTKFFMKIKKPTTPTALEEMQDFIKFSFPSKGDLTDLRLEEYKDDKGFVAPDPQNPEQRYPPKGMRLDQEDGWYIHGSFDDFVRFSLLLKKSQWEVQQIRNLFATLINRGLIEKTRYSGQLDGYEVLDQNGNKVRENGEFKQDYEKFFKDVDQACTGVELFKKQKQGVAWLYQRNSALLGDDTGCGKTVETITAAKMRLQQSGGRCIIFTIKNAQFQWVRELQGLLGENARDISTDPSSNAKWVIMSYSDVSSQPKNGPNGFLRSPSGAPVVARKATQEFLDALFTSQWTVAIFDEAHILKNDQTGTAKNIKALAEKIPFKWGASATFAANTALDVHNVLEIVGHPLGRLSTRDFTKEFVGAKATMKAMKTEEIVALQEKGAYNLRKWLTLSGAYLARSQKAMNPNIPDHDISEMYISQEDFDMDDFAHELASLTKNYKGGAAITKLTGQRVVLAQKKVPHTIAEAKRILETGDRVLIFSCFKETCNQLVSQLNAYLKTVDPDLTVVHIKDGDKGVDIKKAVDSFKSQDSLARVMVIASLKGGTGISLENSTQSVIMNDFDWTPRICKQTEGRAFRINNYMPVNTKYMVVEGTVTNEKGEQDLNPDALFYRYVRSKIEIAKIIQELDSKAEETLLSGMDDSEVQKDIQVARAEDRRIQVQLAEDLNRLMERHGEEGIFNADNVDLDRLDEEENLRNEEEGPQNPPVIASGWYGKAIS